MKQSQGGGRDLSSPPPNVPSNTSDRTLAHLTEYDAVMGEIANRTSSQHTLMNIALTSGAAIAGFALANPKQSVVALVLPFVVAALGAIWLDHARQITKIGIYVSTALWPQVRESIAFPEMTSHEDWVRDQDRYRLAWIAFVLPLMLIFVFPAYAALVYCRKAAAEGGLMALWWIGLLLTLASSIYWVGYYFNHTVLTRLGEPYKPGNWSGVRP